MRDIIKSIQDDQLNNRLHINNVLLDNEIEKGKKADIGEVRKYSGVLYEKVSSTGNPNKDWVRVNSNKTNTLVETKKDEGEFDFDTYKPSKYVKAYMLRDKKMVELDKLINKYESGFSYNPNKMDKAIMELNLASQEQTELENKMSIFDKMWYNQHMLIPHFDINGE
jgi:hypothetical protein